VGATHVSDMLKHNNHLRHLVLSDNAIGQTLNPKP